MGRARGDVFLSTGVGVNRLEGRLARRSCIDVGGGCGGGEAVAGGPGAERKGELYDSGWICDLSVP